MENKTNTTGSCSLFLFFLKCFLVARVEMEHDPSAEPMAEHFFDWYGIDKRGQTKLWMPLMNPKTLITQSKEQ